MANTTVWKTGECQRHIWAPRTWIDFWEGCATKGLLSTGRKHAQDDPKWLQSSKEMWNVQHSFVQQAWSEKSRSDETWARTKKSFFKGSNEPGSISRQLYVMASKRTHCQHIGRSLAVFFRGLKLTLEYIFKSALSRILYCINIYFAPSILSIQTFCNVNIPIRYLATVYCKSLQSIDIYSYAM